MSGDSLSDCPPEIIYEIIQFLPVRSIVEFMLTSKTSLTLCATAVLQQKSSSHDLLEWPVQGLAGSISSQGVPFFMEYCDEQWIRKMITYTQYQPTSVRVFQKLAKKKWENLQSLHLRIPKEKTTRKILAMVPDSLWGQLIELSLVDIDPNLSLMPVMAKLLSKLSKVKSFALSTKHVFKSFLPTTSPFYKQLEKVYLKKNSYDLICQQDNTVNFDLFPNVTSLVVEAHDFQGWNFTVDSWKSLLQIHKQLVRFEFHSIAFQLPGDISKLLDHGVPDVLFPKATLIRLTPGDLNFIPSHFKEYCVIAPNIMAETVSEYEPLRDCLKSRKLKRLKIKKFPRLSRFVSNEFEKKLGSFQPASDLVIKDLHWEGDRFLPIPEPLFRWVTDSCSKLRTVHLESIEFKNQHLNNTIEYGWMSLKMVSCKMETAWFQSMLSATRNTLNRLVLEKCNFVAPSYSLGLIKHNLNMKSLISMEVIESSTDYNPNLFQNKDPFGNMTVRHLKKLVVRESNRITLSLLHSADQLTYLEVADFNSTMSIIPTMIRAAPTLRHLIFTDSVMPSKQECHQLFKKLTNLSALNLMDLSLTHSDHEALMKVLKKSPHLCQLKITYENKVNAELFHVLAKHNSELQELIVMGSKTEEFSPAQMSRFVKRMSRLELLCLNYDPGVDGEELRNRIRKNIRLPPKLLFPSMVMKRPAHMDSKGYCVMM